jgi:hypothetical protein
MTYQIRDFSMGFHATELITISSFSYFNAANSDVLGSRQRLLVHVKIAKIVPTQVGDGMTYQIRDFSTDFYATELTTVSSFSYFNAADSDVLACRQRLLVHVEFARFVPTQVGDGMTYQIRDFSMGFHATELITASSFSYFNTTDRDVLG